MLLIDIFDERLINLDLRGTTKDTCFEELVGAIAALRADLDSAEMLSAIYDREAKMETSVMAGVAVPHGYCRGFEGIIGAIGLSRKGIDYCSAHHGPVHLLFLLLLGEGSRDTHLRVLSRLLHFLQSGAAAHIQQAKDPQEVRAILRDAPAGLAQGGGFVLP
ncbi:MAG: PTS sugar transporter subunit IIA [Treponema sp.]|jgi:mannitol/fructose-specific phosphotransferase system IIA component (Ntr-type)|nr:PTS sugar transporter subunit IIA [Treponema sp.]